MISTTSHLHGVHFYHIVLHHHELRQNVHSRKTRSTGCSCSRQGKSRIRASRGRKGENMKTTRSGGRKTLRAATRARLWGYGCFSCQQCRSHCQSKAESNRRVHPRRRRGTEQVFTRGDFVNSEERTLAWVDTQHATAQLIINSTVHLRKCYFWLADSQSKEGRKVQAKYGVGEATSVLVLAPGKHIPQCVEIFNEANISEKSVLDALEAAHNMIDHEVMQETDVVDDLEAANSLESSDREVREHRLNYFQNQQSSGKGVKENQDHDDATDNEVTFGPVERTVEDDLSTTVENVKSGGTKKKKKNKKKNKKRNRKGNQEPKDQEPKDQEPKDQEPEEKRLRL